MNDLESLAFDFIRLPPRTLPEDWIAVTVDDVAEMLRQARVREPWHSPELGCYSLAQCINLPLGYRSINNAGKPMSKERLGRDPGVNEGKPARTKADRARDAIDELRRALPSASLNSKAVLRNPPDGTYRRLPTPRRCERSKIFRWPPRGARF